MLSIPGGFGLISFVDDLLYLIDLVLMLWYTNSEVLILFVCIVSYFDTVTENNFLVCFDSYCYYFWNYDKINYYIKNYMVHCSHSFVIFC